MEKAASARLKMGLGQKAVVALLLTVVLVPPLAGFYSYFSGVPLHLLAVKKVDKEGEDFDRGQLLAGAGPSPHGGGLRRGRRRLANPQGGARLDRGRTSAGDDAAAGASRLDGDQSRTARPHPSSIRSGPSGRAGASPGSLTQDRKDGVPRAEAG